MCRGVRCTAGDISGMMSAAVLSRTGSKVHLMPGVDAMHVQMAAIGGDRALLLEGTDVPSMPLAAT